VGKKEGTSVRGVVGRAILGFAVLATVAAIAYAVSSPWVSTWGATEEEAQAALPGDDAAPQATTRSTRAVTIDAPPEEVWPWLVQMGWGRAGFYSYNWIENLLGGDLHNVGRIHPDWQDLKVGDDIWMAPAGRYGESTRLEVIQIHPDRTLVVGHPGQDSGAFVLVPTGDGNTRLIVRDRDDMGSENLLSAFFINAIYRPGHFVMERGQMLGIKALAEGAPSERSLIERISFVCVLAAALGLVAMLFPRRRWPWTLIIASVGACLTTLVFFVWYPSVVLGLLLALAVLAALVWTYRPPAAASEHPGDEGEATSTSG
jgi:hypothetical protein